jgi:hypothetical protein
LLFYFFAENLTFIHKKARRALIIIGVIIVISVIAGIAGGGDSGTSVATNTNTEVGATPAAIPQEKSSAKFLKAGMYKVGSELPSGEYIIEATGNQAYYEVSSNSSGEFDSIIVNDTFDKGAFAYIILQDGDYITDPATVILTTDNIKK